MLSVAEFSAHTQFILCGWPSQVIWMLLPLFASYVFVALAWFFWASPYYRMGWTLFDLNYSLAILLFRQILSLLFHFVLDVWNWPKTFQRMACSLCYKIRKPKRSFRYIWIISFYIENITLNWLIICLGTQQKFLVTFYFSSCLCLSTLSLGEIWNNSSESVKWVIQKFKDIIIFILLVEGFYLKLAWE